MATNQIYPDIEEQRRVIAVPTNTAPGTAVIYQGTPMVTLTGSGDHSLTSTLVAGDTTTVITKTNAGGIGLKALQATATPTGTFAFPVVGATASAAYNADGSGKLVYAVVNGSGVVTSLTLTVGSNVLFGRVDFFRGEVSSTDTAVKIGAAN